MVGQPMAITPVGAGLHPARSHAPVRIKGDEVGASPMPQPAAQINQDRGSHRAQHPHDTLSPKRKLSLGRSIQPCGPPVGANLKDKLRWPRRYQTNGGRGQCLYTLKNTTKSTPNSKKHQKNHLQNNNVPSINLHEISGLGRGMAFKIKINGYLCGKKESIQ